MTQVNQPESSKESVSHTKKHLNMASTLNDFIEIAARQVKEEIISAFDIKIRPKSKKDERTN